MREKRSRRQSEGSRFSNWLWGDSDDRSGIVRWLLGLMRLSYFVMRGFIDHQCMLRASALTFVTLLSLVPLIALVVSVGRGFGVDDLMNRVSSKVESRAPGSPADTTPPEGDGPPPATDDATTTTGAPLELQTTTTVAMEDRTTTTPEHPKRHGILLGPDEISDRSFGELLGDVLTTQLTADQEEVWTSIVTYVERTDFSTLTAMGILFLVVTAIMAVGTMEDVFNEIWGVRRARSLMRKFTDYLSVVVLCPILLIASIAITTLPSIGLVGQWLEGVGLYEEARRWFFSLSPYLFVWVALTFLYAFLPNTRVRIRYALIGGFVASVVWQIAFWGCTTFVGWMTRYNMIYSTLAVLPIFMTWLYVSWLIVLLGAEVAATCQNFESYARHQTGHEISTAERLQLGLNLVMAICARFRREQSPWNADNLSRYLECPPRLADELLHDLTESNIVMPSGKTRMPTFIPAVPLANISPARVIEALQESGASGAVGNATPEALCARTLMDQWRGGLWRELGEVGFDVLADEIQPPTASPPPQEPDSQ